MVFCASQAHYNYGHHVHMHFNQNTHNQLCQCNIKRDGGMIPKDKGGMFNLWGHWEKSIYQEENPSKPTTFPFLIRQPKLIPHELVV